MLSGYELPPLTSLSPSFQDWTWLPAERKNREATNQNSFLFASTFFGWHLRCYSFALS